MQAGTAHLTLDDILLWVVQMLRKRPNMPLGALAVAASTQVTALLRTRYGKKKTWRKFITSQGDLFELRTDMKVSLNEGHALVASLLVHEEGVNEQPQNQVAAENNADQTGFHNIMLQEVATEVGNQQNTEVVEETAETKHNWLFMCAYIQVAEKQLRLCFHSRWEKVCRR